MTMASLKRIEALASRLNYKEPAWIRGYEKRDNHLSGALREAQAIIWGDRTGVAHEVLTADELTITGLLEEAAETLDDAHEEWLNTTLAARDLVGDIAAVRCDDPRDEDMRDEPTEHWFGGFHPSWDDDSAIEIQTYVEWPNLGITVDALTQVLQGKEYKL